MITLVGVTPIYQSGKVVPVGRGNFSKQIFADKKFWSFVLIQHIVRTSTQRVGNGNYIL